MVTLRSAQPERLFEDRRDAGRRLALALKQYADEHPIVLALPRGGVPVAFEVAKALRCDLDLLFVRKIGRHDVALVELRFDAPHILYGDGLELAAAHPVAGPG